jgi:hypothetical protein
VDPHGREGQFEAFTANLEAAGLGHLVEPILKTSHDARADVRDRSVHVLFVDGNHKYANVVEDIDDWTSALAPGAFVGFNDLWLPGVNRALRHRICRSGTPYRNARWLVNSLFFDYLPDAPWTSRDRLRMERLRAFLRAGRAWTGFTRAAREGASSPRARRVFAALHMRVARPTLKAILPEADDVTPPAG